MCAGIEGLGVSWGGVGLVEGVEVEGKGDGDLREERGEVGFGDVVWVVLVVE